MMHQIKTSAAADATASLDAAKMHFVQGIKHYEAGKFDKVQVSFEASLTCFPGRVSTLGNLGATLVKLGQPAAALPMAFDAPAYPAVNFQTVQPIRCLGGGIAGLGVKRTAWVSTSARRSSIGSSSGAGSPQIAHWPRTQMQGLIDQLQWRYQVLFPNLLVGSTPIEISL